RITFAGIKSATTCIAGPGRYPTSYHLQWEAAKGRSMRPRKIFYNVYEATTRGGENFSKPTYTTDPGVTSFDTPKLTNEGTYYFVVRARDKAGHEDSNTVEREGQNLCE
ncbi:MAG TPA: fibronectin type III domain-containing protein, partial [Solirubrobacteraceae bacterium]|nr:fibronectin type III domain-containing protein [Solirubrobacteraceae bacterium]